MVDFPNKKIFLYSDVVDFRCGINTLTNLVSTYFPNSNIYDSLYIFFSKNKAQVKIIEIEKDGVWLYHNKLNKYRFVFPRSIQTTPIDSKQLKFILKNIEMIKIRSK